MKEYSKKEIEKALHTKTEITFDEACKSLFGFKIRYNSYFLLKPKEIITVI